MVQIEGRVAGRRKEVARRVTGDGVVAATVHAQVAVGEIALQTILEVADSGAVEEVEHLVDCGPGSGLNVDVAAETAGVVVEASAVLGCDAIDEEGGSKGAEVYSEAVFVSTTSTLGGGGVVGEEERCVLLEGSGGNAATTVARLQGDTWRR